MMMMMWVVFVWFECVCCRLVRYSKDAKLAESVFSVFAKETGRELESVLDACVSFLMLNRDQPLPGHLGSLHPNWWKFIANSYKELNGPDFDFDWYLVRLRHNTIEGISSEMYLLAHVYKIIISHKINFIGKMNQHFKTVHYSPFLASTHSVYIGGSLFIDEFIYFFDKPNVRLGYFSSGNHPTPEEFEKGLARPFIPYQLFFIGDPFQAIAGTSCKNRNVG